MSVDLTQLTAHLSPEQQEAVKKAYRKRDEHPTAAFLWCFFLGTCGAHRFYLRQWGAGLARLIVPLAAVIIIILGVALQWPAATVAGIAIVLLLIALIWEIIDLFRIDHEVYERNLKLAEELIAGVLLADHSVEQKALGRMEFLMDETEQASAAAAQREERETTAEAAAAVPEPVAAVSEAAAPGAGETSETAEVAESRETESAGAGVASAEYVSHTVSEISADPNETQHGGEPLYSPEHNWSESAFVHAEDEGGQTGEQSGGEEVSESGALGEAAVGIGAAVVGGLALDELATRSHEETDHSATDSLETFTTLGAAESEQTDEAVAAEAETASLEPPTPTESEALTWPDHPPVNFEEPAPAASDVGAQPAAPDAGFDATPLAAAALAGAALGGAAALMGADHDTADPSTTPAPSATSRADVTDMGTLPEAAPPIADIEGAAPLFVALPGPASASSEETPTLQVEPAPAASPSGDEALLLLVPNEAEEQPVFEAEPLGMANEAAPSPESYIPPTVPVVSVPAESMVGPIIPPLAPESEPESEPEPEHSSGETLAELAALAGGAGLALGGAELLHAHSESAPAEPATNEPEMAPLGSTAPATVEEPAATDGGAQLSAPAVPLAEAAETAAAAEPPRRQMRRIREYLKVKRGDQETEELVAEELVEVGDDPEPVRQRLRAQLHQQAVEHGLE